jgi:uncharacterized membrane protein
MDSPKIVGAVIGLVIGIVFVWLGIWQAVVAGLFALIGWTIGKYISGEIPIIDALLERFVSSRMRGPRD